MSLITCTNTKTSWSAAQTWKWLDETILPVADELATTSFFACLPAALISAAVDRLAGTGIRVGAQDAWYEPGDDTGETPATLLAELGCTHVMLGHTDRRARGEDDNLVARKAGAVHASGMTPLICVGEPEKTDTHTATEHTLTQVRACIAGLPDDAGIYLMYEPGWTVGSIAAEPTHVAAVFDGVRTGLADRPRELALFYGGGVVAGTYRALRSAGAKPDGLGLGRVVKEANLLREVLDEIATSP
ncbi:triose-phosphate isomerase [Nocardia mikamii]|uniref:triose-phosphate isomerase n=1 Tax=Nocardia mikamii TaxID=508464 RepID=UPI0007A49DDD|nr:triose-phosphate isomerase family protein [Nocardia mikamii]